MELLINRYAIIVFIIGLATEFMTKDMAKGVYGKKGPSGYSAIYQDYHRGRYDQYVTLLSYLVERYMCPGN